MDQTVVDVTKLKEYSLLEVKRHDGGVMLSTLKLAYDAENNENKRKDILDEMGLYSDRSWLIIHGLIIDVSEFKKKHPGGEFVVANCVGKDATEDFEDTFHSLRARSLLKPLVVGKLKDYKGNLNRAFVRG